MRRRRDNDRNAGRRRRGFTVSTFLVIATPMFVLMIGLAVEVALVNVTRERLQGAADAAALAAAAELLDPDTLMPAAVVDPTTAQQNANAAALLYSNLNVGIGRPLTYLSNSPILVVFANVADPTDRYSPLGPVDAANPCNTVVVTIERSQRLKNPVPLRLGPFLGILPGNVVATARGTLDRRVYGVRPIGALPCPVVPLAVSAAGNATSWTTQATSAAVSGVNDVATVNPTTGAVTPGPDGVPEVTLSTTTNLAVLSLGTTAPATQMEQGVYVSDLEAYGGALALSETGVLTVPTTTLDGGTLSSSLTSIIGVNRVWPLYDASQSTLGGGTAVLVGFASAHVVSASSTTILVQPSIFPTASALVRPGQPLNPYVGKLGLTR